MGHLYTSSSPRKTSNLIKNFDSVANFCRLLQRKSSEQQRIMKLVLVLTLCLSVAYICSAAPRLKSPHGNNDKMDKKDTLLKKMKSHFQSPGHRRRAQDDSECVWYDYASKCGACCNPKTCEDIETFEDVTKSKYCFDY